MVINNDHRPWPVPSRPWVMSQSWEELLFMHWPVPAAALRPHIPSGLAIDTFEGQAWIAVVPFTMRRTRPYRLPLPFGLGDLPELNVRTYVVRDDRPGVWFFSLDAGQALAVYAARLWYHLPYFHARMSVLRQADHFAYRSARIHRHAPAAAFTATYGPSGDVYHSQPGTLENWLTERYCLYAVDRRRRLYRGENAHVPWPLQPAEAEVAVNTLCAPLGVTLPDTAPLLHFARRLDVVFWALERMSD